MTHKTPPSNDLIVSLVADALQLGADQLDVEYKDGYERICAMKAHVGIGIATLKSSGAEACDLRERLYAMTRKKASISVQGKAYTLKAELYDSFGEDAFRVAIHEK